MKLGKRVLLFSLVFVCSAVMAWALGTGKNDGYVQTFDNGEVNWQSGVITAVGIGAPPANAVNMAQARALARRAAIVVARRNLLEIVKGVRIDSETTVQEYMVTSDIIRTSVSGYLQNSQILDVAYMSDGSVEATVGVSLRGGLAKIVIPKTMPFKFEEPQVVPEPEITTPAPAPQPALPAPSEPVPALPAPTEPAPTPAQIVTGLVVDASGSGARPAMSPKIYDEQGTEVYGSALVSREYAIQQGMAGYAKDIEKATTRPRVTDKPLVVKALSAKGKGMSDLVISNADANTLRELAENQSFLEKCRVMIVLN
jgi:hypothetical protein